jgi:hypothetical protein
MVERVHGYLRELEKKKTERNRAMRTGGTFPLRLCNETSLQPKKCEPTPTTSHELTVNFDGTVVESGSPLDFRALIYHTMTCGRTRKANKRLAAW